MDERWVKKYKQLSSWLPSKVNVFLPLGDTKHFNLPWAKERYTKETTKTSTMSDERAIFENTPS